MPADIVHLYDFVMSENSAMKCRFYFDSKKSTSTTRYRKKKENWSNIGDVKTVASKKIHARRVTELGDITPFFLLDP
jgi:hypothetical protein